MARLTSAASRSRLSPRGKYDVPEHGSGRMVSRQNAVLASQPSTTALSP